MMYTPTKVTVAEDQMEKMKSSIGKPSMKIKIQLKNKKEEDPHTLLLTKGQIRRLNETCRINRRSFKTIQFSKKQIEANLKYKGDGFISILAALASRALPMIVKGVASGLISTATKEILKKKADGLYLFKKGHGMKVDLVKGNGLYITPHSSAETVADGLYLKRGSTIHAGEGLILGKNSPFKNIPVLGWIL